MEAMQQQQSYSDMPEDLEDELMTERDDTAAHHTFTKERQPRAMLELSHHQRNQPSQPDHAPSHPQPSEDHG